ncbi:MAG: response regulator [candidate division Zixibacteria bacterium]|nr:response regulator [candidate division Zixibacteria bacterium]
MKILVIEDHTDQRKLAHHILTTAGYTVSDADAAEYAVTAIKNDKPHVILLDLSLPGMDGLTLARHLKQDPETRDIVIVAVTSYPERFSKADALKAGCDAYLVKPLNTRGLPEEIDGVVNRKQRESQQSK